LLASPVDACFRGQAFFHNHSTPSPLHRPPMGEYPVSVRKAVLSRLVGRNSIFAENFLHQCLGARSFSPHSINASFFTVGGAETG